MNDKYIIRAFVHCCWTLREWSLFNNRGGWWISAQARDNFSGPPPVEGLEFFRPPSNTAKFFWPAPPLNYSNARAFSLKEGEILRPPPLEGSTFLRPPPPKSTNLHLLLNNDHSLRHSATTFWVPLSPLLLYTYRQNHNLLHQDDPRHQGYNKLAYAGVKGRGRNPHKGSPT